MTLEFISCCWISRFCLIAISRIFRWTNALTRAIIFRGAAAKPAQLSDNQGIGFVKQLQKFIDPALLTGFARRDRHFDKLVNFEAPFSGKFQKHQLLVI